MKLFIAILFALLTAGIIVLSIYLPYTTTNFERRTVEQVEQSDRFNLGPLTWNIDHYQTDSTLQPLRDYFSLRCAGTTGRTAGQCVSVYMVREFPFGLSPDELFQETYDPAKSIEIHSKGAPGDCVTRAGLAASVLLSVGIPARVVQLVPRSTTEGHNIFSVWDKDEGWVALDPTTGMSLKSEYGVSETALWRSPETVVGNPFTEPPQGFDLSLMRSYYELFSDYLTYPEPWLYMRTGPRKVYWPYRALFVEVGRDKHWSLGTTQLALSYAGVFSGGLAALFGWLWFGEDHNFKNGQCVYCGLQKGSSMYETEHDWNQLVVRRPRRVAAILCLAGAALFLVWMVK